MFKLFSQITNRNGCYVKTFRRNLQTTKPAPKKHCCKVLVVGGGNGGSSVAARFARTLCKHEIIIVEPTDIHYCQSMFTLIGAGINKLRDTCKPMLQVLPLNATWFKDEVEAFYPKSNLVKTKKGESIEYEIIVISVGVKLDLEQISGLPEALENYGDVSTIYSPLYAEKTFKTMRRFTKGNAIFTHPKTAVKCLGASQKICYLAEHYFRKNDKLCDANIIYAMGQHTLFPIKRYEAALWKVVEKRNIDVQLHTNLIEVQPDKNQAVFECMEKPGNKISLEYSLLHVTPPMSPPDALKSCKDLVDDEGYVAVHRNTLRHEIFPNVYALGDCSSTPNSKTSSAISAQSFVVYNNAKAYLEGKDNTVNYSGYAACPIITGCRLLIVGGGSAGCTIASKFAKNLRKKDIIILEPKVDHLYQSMFTLIGAGVKTMRDAWRPMAETLPQNVTWFNDSVAEFDPKNDTVTTKNGKVIQYQFVVIAVGIKPDYYKVIGLKEALDRYPEVVTIYAPEYVEKTFKSFNDFIDGNAIFTHPSTPVKCPGASQKICYLAEHYFRKKNKRYGADMIYTIGYPDIFQAKKYADALWKVAENRSIEVRLNTDLKQVDPESRTTVFECSETPGEKIRINYSLLHVTPPMSPPDELQACEELVNADGYVDVNQYTLRHNKFENAYAIGDCIGAANSKTTSAIGAQSLVVYNNLRRNMCGEEPSLKYNGYSACPIITSYGTCILAEFDYSFKPLETFPVKQDVERRFTYYLKKELMPKIYWNFLLKGLWDGPENFRKVFHFKIRS